MDDFHPPTVSEIASATSLMRRLERVRRSLLELEGLVDRTSFGREEESARNLLHYLAFRRFDLRRDQARLAHWGLSSLGRSESHVLYNLDVVLGWLHLLRGDPVAERPAPDGTDPERGQRMLARNARALLGPTRPGRGVRIMVTMPAEAATDPRLVRELLLGGMDCARINCAHEGPQEWARMIDHIRRAERAVGRHCRIEMDLAGPKIRTGPMRPGPPVMKLRPTRDALGRVTAAASVGFVALEDLPLNPTDSHEIPVSREWLHRRRLGDRVRLTDARGSHRTMRIVTRADDRCAAEVEKTTYVTTGTHLTATRARGRPDTTAVGPVAPLDGRIRLRLGDRIVVTAAPDPGEDVRRGARGRVTTLAHIACTLPEGLQFVRRGESIWFDDGHIGGKVRSASKDRLVVQITHAPPEGTWLGADKGINLPETRLELPSLPAKDVEDLRFVARHADLVGLSFVHSPSDLEALRLELALLRRPRLGVVLKVETGRAFANLPALLLGALRHPPVAVMIARGDLAVEVGFERLAEVQEEILWLCEAAHLPAIWATQVLEGLAKTGLPSRAEVTDAAMGERAECVMLNKGPHMVEAVRALDSILRRMQAHQSKKMAMLRPLAIVNGYRSPGGKAGPARSPVVPRRRRRQRGTRRRHGNSSRVTGWSPGSDR